ncbi:polymeric immunoglobulin receptor-like isoform X2 [Paralichthys olivaceus]|uniref:polymeric immunoglobulin receptor-like isoform X2 n=1 Tax=Paralichthys olivaceus TaxID=8255 RepID=UPI003752188F
MNVRYTLICSFFLSVGSAKILVYSANEGGNITVQCSLSSIQSRKFFCLDKCTAADILIETTENSARIGRYSINYQNQGYQKVLSVTITQLSKSDSGTYQCGSGTFPRMEKLQIIVTDVYLDRSSEVKPLYKRSGENVTVECAFTNPGTMKTFYREEGGEKMNMLVQTTGDKHHRGRYSIVFITGSKRKGFVFVTITDLVTSDSGRYRCSVGGESYRHFDVIVRDESTSSPASPETTKPSETQPVETTGADASFSTNDVMLPVGLTLVVMVVLLSGAALIFCRNRTNKPRARLSVRGNQRRGPSSSCCGNLSSLLQRHVQHNTTSRSR